MEFERTLALTPTQRLSKPATRWMPHKGYALRAFRRGTGKSLGPADWKVYPTSSAASRVPSVMAGNTA